jgi:TrmH family RNA methyltransferase
MSEDAAETGVITDLARERNVEITLAGPRVIASLSDAATPQGVVAVAPSPLKTLDALSPGDLVVVLAEVRDPGNAGTLLRSAAAAGASAVIFTSGSVDPLNSKTVRAAAGALFSIPVVSRPSLEDVIGRLREGGVEILGAAADAPQAATSRDLTRPLALVLGNEAWGLSSRQRRLLDAVVGIPMPGRADSLNVAVAGSILLFEVVRQRTARDRGDSGLSSAPKIHAPMPDRD